MSSILIWNKITEDILTCLPQPESGGVITAEAQLAYRGLSPEDYNWMEIKPNLTTKRFKEGFYVSDGAYFAKEKLNPSVEKVTGLTTVTFSANDSIIINVDGENFTIDPESTGEAILELESPIPAEFILKADQRKYYMPAMKVNVL